MAISDDLLRAIETAGLPNGLFYGLIPGREDDFVCFNDSEYVQDDWAPDLLTMHFLRWLTKSTGELVELFLGLADAAEAHSVCVGEKNFTGTSSLQAATEAVNAQPERTE